MKSFSFGQQIVVSFGAIAVVFLVASYLVNHHTTALANNIEQVEELRLPTAQASKNLSNGISRSLAALRGWLILEDPQFKTERDEAWQLDIEPALLQLTKLSKDWTNPENITRLEAIRLELALFRRSQEEIARIAHTLDSTPATKILIENAKPIGDNLLHNIIAMIELSSQKLLSEKELALFKDMADFRGSFAQVLVSTRLFLMSADAATQLDFKNNWRANEDSFTRMLIGEHLMSPEQKVLFKIIKLKRDAFYKYSQKMFGIRMSDGHNQSYNLLKTQAAPSAKLILSILDKMVADQWNLLDKEIVQQANSLQTLRDQTMYSILLGFILTMMLGFIIVKSFKKLNYDIAFQTDALHSSVATNRGILDTSKDSIVSITTTGEILSCNNTTLKMFGYRKEELIGQNVRMLMPEPFSREHDDYLVEHMRTKIKKDVWGGTRELIAKKKDGSTFPIFLSIGSVATGNEQIFTGYIRDITDQKTAQDKLETLNRNLRLENFTQEQIAKINEVMHGASDMRKLGDRIIESLAELISASNGILYRYDTDTDTDTDTGVLSVVSTYSLYEMIESRQKVQIGDGLVGQCARSKAVIHTANIPQDYIKIKSGLGEGNPKELLIFPILFEEQLLGVVELATFSAISEEQKKVIDVVRSDIGIVIKNVIGIEKTNLLLQRMQQQSEVLQEQSQKLSQSNAYKSDFLATMSHEIRTPMNGVLGMLGMLIKSDLSESQMKKASMARSSAQSLLTIINDILDFSKVESGKLELEMLDFDLRTLLEELAELMAIKAHEKGINLNLDIINIPYSMVKGDGSRIRQVFVNLVGNALKFTHRGDITISASLHEHEPGKLKFICSVEDTGIGLTKQQQGQLFEAFRQADASTTREYGGTGLGLSICKKLCELMGGGISVSGELGQGSQFEFTVILDQSMESTLIESPLKDAPLRILVVDRQGKSRDILAQQFKAWGGQVSATDNSKEALSLLTNCADKECFHIAFINVDHVDQNFQELLKRCEDLLPTQFALMYSDADDQNVQKYPNSLQYTRLRKPVTPSLIVKAVLEIQDYEGVTKPNSIKRSTSWGASRVISIDKFPHRGDNPRILLVEDNFINQETMKFMLEDLGVIADVASDGQEAITMLNAAENGEYSLVLMDCQMPIMDGYTATRYIRNGDGCAKLDSIPIIALTANAMSSDRERCLAAGMNDYLSKPIDPGIFSEMLHKWLT